MKETNYWKIAFFATVLCIIGFGIWTYYSNKDKPRKIKQLENEVIQASEAAKEAERTADYFRDANELKNDKLDSLATLRENDSIKLLTIQKRHEEILHKHRLIPVSDLQSHYDSILRPKSGSTTE